MAGLLSPRELHNILIDADDKKMAEERKEKARAEQQKKELMEAFMSRELHPEVAERLNRAVQIAAERGQTSVEVMNFPSKFCNDRGRRINNGDPDWPTRWRASQRGATNISRKS